MVMFDGRYDLYSMLEIGRFCNKDKNKWHGSNSHDKHTREEAARRKSKYKKLRNKKRKMLKFRRKRNK